MNTIASTERLFCNLDIDSVCDNCPLVASNSSGISIMEVEDTVMISNRYRNRFYAHGKPTADETLEAFLKCTGAIEQKRLTPLIPSKKTCAAILELGLKK